MTEVLVIAIVAIVVVGPKDLPKLLRTVGKTISGVKRMAGDFQQQFNDAIDDADLGDVKNLATGKKINPLDSIKEATSNVMSDINDGLNDAGKKTNDIKADAEPLFPENETSKRLAEMTIKDTLPSAPKSTKKAPAKSAKKTTTKKTTAKKPVSKKATTKAASAKKATPKKAIPKKSGTQKTASRSKSKSA